MIEWIKYLLRKIMYGGDRCRRCNGSGFCLEIWSICDVCDGTGYAPRKKNED